jgi:hypothetical protein
MSQITDANSLVAFIKDFTGSTNDAEVKECIFMGEMMMRNVELPIQRSDPYNSQFQAVADSNGMIPIPGDMLKPIIFFKMGGVQGQSQSGGGNGPWIVYDRIGDRDIITESLIEALYLKPINIPSVYRGKFSEVGQKYKMLPGLGEGDIVNLYYYRAWPFLFSIDTNGDTVLSNGVLQTFPEGYVYSTLHCYYVKRHSEVDAATYKAKFEEAVLTIGDQNSKGKWSGGHTRMTSIFQPRKDRRYTAK